eukprot:1957767-Amphidinium_carterae.1
MSLYIPSNNHKIYSLRIPLLKVIIQNNFNFKGRGRDIHLYGGGPGQDLHIQQVRMYIYIYRTAVRTRFWRVDQ